MPTLFLAAVQKHQDHNALAFRSPGQEIWTFWTYREYYDQCWNFAKSCIKVCETVATS